MVERQLEALTLNALDPLLDKTQEANISKDARIADALGEIGPSVMVGAATTFLGIMPLAFASNAISRVFFRMFLIIISFGVRATIFDRILALSVPCHRCFRLPLPPAAAGGVAGAAGSSDGGRAAVAVLVVAAAAAAATAPGWTCASSTGRIVFVWTTRYRLSQE